MDGPFDAQLGDRLDVRERCVRERQGRCPGVGAGHVGDAVVHDPVHDVDGVVVGREVSMHPPWSTDTSTITEPLFMVASIRRVIKTGVLPPGTSTAPMTMSASAISTSRVCADMGRVRTRPLKISSIRVRPAVSLLITTVSMPSPMPTRAALAPTTPAPRTTIFPGRTPETPVGRTPEPPLNFWR